ncbi:hypothetical protein [Fervidobacterium sp. 2310opik-2]|uniref:hypothetical protein n=1 Tax=Fervidobacterium sp. 2310opik-2 TaxID=1755815 RepID=UPI0013DF798D|nr:hypothetical protein [Fervidobacterium sp. 2310opik-2]KAF2960864.1 hypothetical protein AS161_04020 [Fervidobacterium sp. 2310opik-2]
MKYATFKSSMKAKSNLVILFFALFYLILLPTKSLAVIDEETARNYFSQSLIQMYQGNFQKAYELSKQALSGRVYVNEIANFWFLRGRLAIANGLIDKAIEEFGTFTQLVKNDDIDNILEKVRYFRNINLSPSKNFELKYIGNASGIIKGIEYFQTPVSVAVYGDSYCVLDSKNRRIVYFKNNRMTNIKKVSHNIKQIIFDRNGSLYLVSENAIYNDSEYELLKGLRSPIVAGFDRNGNMYIVDFDRIVLFNVYSNNITEHKLQKVTPALDAEITIDKLYILNGLTQEIDIYDLKNFSKIQSIKLSEKIWNFEVTPYGDIIYPGKDGLIANDQKFDIKGIDLIEYSYPNLFVMKWKNKQIEHYVLKDDKPLFVNIERLEFDDNFVYAYISVEDLFGDEVHYIQHSLSIFEHDVYAPSDVYSSQITPKYITLKECKGELTIYRLQSLRVLGNCPILTKFTGAPTYQKAIENSKKLIWIAQWNYLRPIPPGVIKVSARVNFKNNVYYDTVFYTSTLIKSEELRKK